MKIIVRDSVAELPAAGEMIGGGPREGDIAFIIPTAEGWFWDGTQWVQFSLGGGMNVEVDYTVTGPGTEVPVSGRGSYALQVTGVGAAATAWDVRLEGSLDGTSWVTLLTHVTGDGDGDVIFTGANRYPVDRIRVNVNALTLGPASAITVTVEAAP